MPNWMSMSAEPSRVFSKATKADANLPGGLCRAILCGTPGTVNLGLEDGTTIVTNFPLQLGYNPIGVLQIRTGGTADDIWPLY